MTQAELSQLMRDEALALGNKHRAELAELRQRHAAMQKEFTDGILHANAERIRLETEALEARIRRLLPNGSPNSKTQLRDILKGKYAEPIPGAREDNYGVQTTVMRLYRESQQWVADLEKAAKEREAK